jgi:hypothetical protein
MNTKSLEFRRARAPKHPIFAVRDRLVWVDATGRYRIVLTKRIAGVEIPKPSRRYLILFDDRPGWALVSRHRRLSAAITRCQRHARNGGAL